MAKKAKESSGDILRDLEQKYGVGRVSPSQLTIVSTGSIQLNQAMKIGGTALGKIIEIFGPESSGKSTITLHQMAEYQKAFPDRKVALIDYEYSFDMDYAAAIGVDVDNLLIYQPDTQEQGYDLVIALVEKDLVSCVVIDSQTAATPKATLEGEMGDSTMALQARINSKFCLKIKGLLAIHKCTLFVISQLRDNIGSMSGEATITTGGKAFRFYSDVRWKIWKLNDKDHELNKTTIDVIKSKVGKQFGSAKVNILWGVGFDKVGEIIDYASEFSFIKKGGAGWYTIGEQKAQGLDGVKELFMEHPEIYEDLEKRVSDKLNNIEIIEEEIVEEEEQNESNGIY